VVLDMLLSNDNLAQTEVLVREALHADDDAGLRFLLHNYKLRVKDEWIGAATECRAVKCLRRLCSYPSVVIRVEHLECLLASGQRDAYEWVVRNARLCKASCRMVTRLSDAARGGAALERVAAEEPPARLLLHGVWLDSCEMVRRALRTSVNRDGALAAVHSALMCDAPSALRALLEVADVQYAGIADAFVDAVEAKRYACVWELVTKAKPPPGPLLEALLAHAQLDAGFRPCARIAAA
jgi:hypothetical protein